jgi:hypothetical protein
MRPRMSACGTKRPSRCAQQCPLSRGKVDMLVFNYAHAAAKSRLQVTRNGRGKRELGLANNALAFAAKHECRH